MKHQQAFCSDIDQMFSARDDKPSFQRKTDNSLPISYLCNALVDMLLLLLQRSNLPKILRTSHISQSHSGRVDRLPIQTQSFSLAYTDHQVDQPIRQRDLIWGVSEAVCCVRLHRSIPSPPLVACAHNNVHSMYPAGTGTIQLVSVSPMWPCEQNSRLH